ncbi:hypothetical protein PTI98_011873 [Pleurotus ostreatus]|nr:hypothetical protein PTI98_011873 [Pleurotus ostreatus]
MILARRANIDIKPVLSKDAAINYIAKYATKAEQQAPDFPELLSEIVNTLDPETTAQSACQKMLNKMLGEWLYSAQETTHLLLSIPLVRSSSAFQLVYIGAEGSMRELGEDVVDDSGNNPDDSDRMVTGKSLFQWLVVLEPMFWKEILTHNALVT